MSFSLKPGSFGRRVPESLNRSLGAGSNGPCGELNQRFSQNGCFPAALSLTKLTARSVKTSVW